MASQGKDPRLLGRDIRTDFAPIAHFGNTPGRVRVAPANVLRSPRTGPVRDVSGPWSGLFRRPGLEVVGRGKPDLALLGRLRRKRQTRAPNLSKGRDRHAASVRGVDM